MRFSRRIEGVRVVLVDAQSRILAVREGDVTLFDPDGSEAGRFSIPPWHHVLSTERGVVTAQGRELSLHSPGGVEAWRETARGEVTALQLAPDGALYVWTRSSSQQIEVESQITRYEHDAAIGWSVVHAESASGYVNAWCLACDDAGELYALCGGRLGDGVSGSDVATGGLAAYSRSGELCFRLREDGNHARRLHARAHGVVLHGHEVRAYDQRGMREWTLGAERYDAPTDELGALELEVVRTRAPEPLPLLVKRGPGSYFQIHAATDGEGQRYFVHEGKVACVDHELCVRWSVRVRGARPWSVPVIGPHGSVLVATDDELIAIE